MKKRCLLVMLLFSVLTAFADNESVNGTENTTATTRWEFMNYTEKGKSNEDLLNQLEGLCVKRVPVVPGDPTMRTVIKKGEIYNAVRKVAKGLGEEVKDDKLTDQEADKLLNKVLNVAISAFYTDDSKSFEKALRENKKDYHRLLAVFSQVMLN